MPVPVIPVHEKWADAEFCGEIPTEPNIEFGLHVNAPRYVMWSVFQRDEDMGGPFKVLEEGDGTGPWANAGVRGSHGDYRRAFEVVHVTHSFSEEFLYTVSYRAFDIGMPIVDGLQGNFAFKDAGNDTCMIHYMAFADTPIPIAELSHIIQEMILGPLIKQAEAEWETGDWELYWEWDMPPPESPDPEGEVVVRPAPSPPFLACCGATEEEKVAEGAQKEVSKSRKTMAYATATSEEAQTKRKTLAGNA